MGAKVEVVPGARDRIDRRGAFAWTDAGLVALVVLFVWFLSGAQRRTFLHTPDSEFYLSLGAFSDDVTDRAPTDLYYWTKLGIILPARFLAYVLNASAALDAFHFLLLALVVGASYRAARIGFPRSMACVAALFISLNTVFLGFLGDPYATGAAMTGLTVLYSCALVWLLERDAGGWGAPAVLGCVCAWLVMVNPYAALLGGVGLLGLVLANLPVVARVPRLGLIASAAALVVSFAVSMAAFLALGGMMFPGLEWFETLRSFSSSADPSVWAEDDWTWLATETSLLVPTVAAMVALVALWRDPRSALARSGAALAGLVPLFALGFKLETGSNVLETSMYSALLWPSALLGVVAGIASLTSGWRSSSLGYLLIVLCPAAWMFAGRWSGTATPTTAGVITGGVCLIVGVTMISSGDRGAGQPHMTPSTGAATLGLIPLLVLGVLFQFLQNGRPVYLESIHPRVEYEAAYNENSSGATVERDLAVQSWLIEQTRSSDRVLVWAEWPFITAAAMQLWGPNSAGSAETGLGEAGLAAVQQVKPTIFVTYSGAMSRADAITDELASQWEVSDRQCRDFSEPGLPELVVCINRLGEPSH